MTKAITTPLTGEQALKLALSSDVDAFKNLTVANQAMVVAATKRLLDKLKRLDTARRLAIQETLPDEGIIGEDFSVKWQTARGHYQLDEEGLKELYPDKVKTITVKQLDPIFAEEYLNKAKNTKPGQPLPPCVAYICGEGRTLVVRTKAKDKKE